MEIEKKDSEKKATTEVKMINIRQLPVWLGQKIKDGDNPLFVRPSTLRTLYQLFFYEFVKYKLSSSPKNEETKIAETDADINLPENLVIVMIQIYYNQTCNSFFQTLDSL